MDLKIKIPDEIEYILKTLEENGFEAYIVGGCVRDAVMKREISDFDITTNARPDDLHRIFEKCIDTGLKHGTVTVVVNHTHAEVTTYRIDGKYENHRKPENVEFVSSLSDDLSRRDFTINAMAYNNGITDLFGGMDDIKNKVIRTVNNAHERFNEDALRIMRAVRFSCTLGFNLCDDVKNAMRDLSHLINFVSKERIKAEFDKLVMSDFVENIALANGLGFFNHIFPKLENITENDLKKISQTKKDLCIRYALLFIIADKEFAKDFLTKYKFSNKEKHDILMVIDFATKSTNQTSIGVKTILSKTGKELFKKIICVKKALSEDTSLLEKIYNKVKNEPYLTKDLKINGNDLIKLGVTGTEIKNILNYLTKKVIENPCCNEKEILLKETNLYLKKS